MMYSVLQRLFIVALSACFLGLSGCAASVALFHEMETIELGDQGIALVVVDAENLVNPDSAPRLNTVRIIGDDNAIFTFSVPDPIEMASGEKLRYLLSFRLPAGNYQMHSARGQNRINASFDESFVIPIQRAFTLQSGEFAYLGHIVATNRDSKPGEEMAGELVVGEAYESAGFAYGTFDVQVLDSSETDISLFKDEYSVLQGRQVAMRVLDDSKAIVTAQTEQVPAKVAVQVSTSEVQDSAIAPSIVSDAAELALPSSKREMRGSLKVGNSTSAGRETATNQQCSVDQVLGMSKLGLSPAQISEACE